MGQGGFSRILPQLTKFLEKPLNRFSSGKIKKLYNGYEDFCKDIGVMLGENELQPKSETLSNIEGFEKLASEIEFSEDLIEKSQQLLGLSSHFYTAGLIVQDLKENSKVLSYFCDASVNHQTILDENFESFSAFLNPDNLLKPKVTSGIAIAKRFNLPLKSQEATNCIIFCLNPETRIFGIFITSLTDENQLNLFLKTQALIQKEFYG